MAHCSSGGHIYLTLIWPHFTALLGQAKSTKKNWKLFVASSDSIHRKTVSCIWSIGTTHAKHLLASQAYLKYIAIEGPEPERGIRALAARFAKRDWHLCLEPAPSPYLLNIFNIHLYKFSNERLHISDLGSGALQADGTVAPGSRFTHPGVLPAPRGRSIVRGRKMHILVCSYYGGTELHGKPKTCVSRTLWSEPLEQPLGWQTLCKSAFNSISSYGKEFF